MGSRRRPAVLLLPCLLAACGGDDVNDAPPRLIEGGGVGDGAVQGVLNVYVIDAGDGSAIAGASVYVGEPGTAPSPAATDSTGLFTLRADDLAGPQTITVTAAGHVPATWFGADGANVTIPLRASAAGDVPQAELTGGIDGFADLPLPDQGHYLLALIDYSHSKDLGDPGNSIETPRIAGMLPQNACARSLLGTQCSWRLRTRTGRMALFAVILDADTHNTPLFDDDTYEVIGYAHKRGVTVEDGVAQAGLMLQLIDVGELANLSFELDEGPAGLLQVIGVPGIDLGDEGVMLINAAAAGPDDLTTTVPALAGDFAGGSYWAVGRAATSADSDVPSTGIVKRGLAAADRVALGDWLPTAADLTVEQGAYSFVPAAGASVHAAEILDGDQPEWEIGLLDGRTSFSLPTLDSDPLPAGTLELHVSAVDVPIDLTDFSLDEVGLAIERLSVNRTTFDH